MDYCVKSNLLTPASTGIESATGAVPLKNEKVEISMKKVMVHRYLRRLTKLEKQREVEIESSSEGNEKTMTQEGEQETPLNSNTITNKTMRGKFKFLKYYQKPHSKTAENLEFHNIQDVDLKKQFDRPLKKRKNSI